MKCSVLTRALVTVALGAAAALPAQAYFVDFEDVPATLFAASSVHSNGFDFASSGAGFSGVDSAAAFSIFGNAPLGSNGQFLFGLNADRLTMTRSNGLAFKILGFDFGFIAPVTGLGAGLMAGMLHVEAMAAGGGTITQDLDFGESDGDGRWSFESFDGNAFAGGVNSVTFSACIYGSAGGCVATDVQAQFAIDDISLVPEPGGVTLALTALGLLAATRRRQTV